MMGDYEYEDDFDYRPSGSSGYLRDSDEDTEDASETESMNLGDEEHFRSSREYRPVDEMKEQCYRGRLAELRAQLAQLEAGIHPEYLKGLEKLQHNYEERKFSIHCTYEWQKKRINAEYSAEERAANAEYEERRNEVKDNLAADLEEKKRHFEAENAHDLSFDTSEPKPTIKRQLRRRPNDPIPMPDRRRRASPAHINYMLDEEQIAEDLKSVQKIINAAKLESRKNRAAERERENSASASGSSSKANSNLANFDPFDPFNFESRIEDGKLFYDKKWFHRGQNVMLESTADNSKLNGIILQIGTTDLTIRKTAENTFKQSNTKVTIADLQIKKYIVHRRS